MRSILPLAAAALLAGPAVAAETGLPPSSSPLYASTSLYAGELELAYAYAWTDKDSTIQEFDATGRLAGPLVGWLKGEGELLGLYYNADYPSGSHSASGVGFIGHFYKQEASHALGVGAGVVTVDGTTTLGTGVEGKVWLGDNALTGQLAYVSVGDNGGDYVLGSGQIDHYFTPDLKGVAAASYASSDKQSLWLASLGVEKRLTATRWSLFASGSYMHVDTSGRGTDIWSVRGGLRAFFDQPGTTLAQHDWLVPFNGSWMTLAAR